VSVFNLLASKDPADRVDVYHYFAKAHSPLGGDHMPMILRHVRLVNGQFLSPALVGQAAVHGFVKPDMHRPGAS